MHETPISRKFSVRTALRKSMRRVALTCCILGIGILTAWQNPCTVFAREVDLTEIPLEALMDVRIRPVVAASKHAQSPLDAPSSITVITSDQIQRYGYQTLADVLQGVRGFFIRNDRDYDYVGYRGINRLGDYSTRVLLLLDGVKMNDNIYDSAQFGADFILDLDLVDHIEIVRGPGYTLYGNNAFFAIINVISKDGETLDGCEAAVSAGSFGTHTGRLSYGKRLEDGSRLLFSGTLLESDGQSLYYPEFDTRDQNNGVAENADAEDAKSLYAKYSRNGITFSSAYVKRGKQIPTAAWGTLFNDNRTEGWDERAFLDLKVERSLTKGLDLVARAAYGLYRYSGDYAFFDEAAGQSYINRDRQQGEWGGVEAHVVHSGVKHTVTAGGEYRDNFTLDQKNYDVAGETYLDSHGSTKNWGLFIQDEFSLLPVLKVNAGLRYDHFSTFGGSLNPRIALIYRPFPVASIKYLAGRSFRAPDPYELFYNDGGLTQRASPDLQEESLISHEVVWEQLIGDHFSSTLGVYRYTIKDLISLTTDSDGLLVFTNQDHMDADGFEIGVDAFSPSGLTAGLSYTYQDSHYHNDDKVMTNSPRHLAKFNISLPILPDHLFLSMEEQYTSRLITLAGASTGDYYLTNLTVYWREAFKAMDVSGSIYNLFDRDYGLPGSDELTQDVISQDGISVLLKVACRF